MTNATLQSWKDKKEGYKQQQEEREVEQEQQERKEEQEQHAVKQLVFSMPPPCTRQHALFPSRLLNPNPSNQVHLVDPNPQALHRLEGKESS